MYQFYLNWKIRRGKTRFVSVNAAETGYYNLFEHELEGPKYLRFLSTYAVPTREMADEGAAEECRREVWTKRIAVVHVKRKDDCFRA